MATDAGVKNIEQLRQFGRNLSIASGNLINLFGKLNTQMHTVCEGWNDDMNRKFMADFEKRCQEIQKIATEMQNYSQFISDIASILNDYKAKVYRH